MASVSYLFSKHLVETASLLPAHPSRAKSTHDLLTAYLKQDKHLRNQISFVEPTEATKEQLCKFHSKEYIEFIEELDRGLRKQKRDENTNSSDEEREEEPESSSESEEDEEDEEEDIEAVKKEYGLEDDASPFPHIYKYIQTIAGASITAAKVLASKKSKIAINWEGGRHHARKAKAAGFCYVNDVVLATMELLKTFDRVMCIDIDVHHGDGTEDAFLFTDRVMSISFHQYGRGLYPGTGNVDVLGKGRGVNFNVNIPLREGANDETYTPLFEEVIQRAVSKFKPLAAVIVCGADALAGDPLGKFNLSIQAYEKAIHFVLKTIFPKDIPLLLLGGGGYNIANAARCFVSVTGMILMNVSSAFQGEMKVLPQDIPDTADYFEIYSPTFSRYISTLQVKNYNSKEYVEEMKSQIMKTLQE